MLKIIFPFLALVIVATVYGFNIPSSGNGESIHRSRKIPSRNFNQTYSENDTVEIRVLNFSQFEPMLHFENDTTYLVNFWATWCIPCRKEIPAFEKLNEQVKNKNVKVLLVSLDMPENLDKTLVSYIGKFNIRSEVLVLDDPNSNYWIDRVDRGWSGTIPATLIYNKNYREFFPYPLTFENLDSIVKLKMIKP